MNIQDLWVVPRRATHDTDIEDVYVVGLEDEDEDSEDEDLERVGEVASSSSSNLRNQPSLSSPVTQAESSTSSNSPQLVFKYDVDEVVLRAIERGRLHEWIVVVFGAICRKHGLSVRGRKSELMERVKVHFEGLY